MGSDRHSAEADASCVRPLTRRSKEGTLYARPQEIENEIAAALERPLGELLGAGRGVSSPCLLYFARNHRPNGHSRIYEGVLMELLDRIDRQVRGRVGGLPPHQRAAIRQDVRDQFLERLFRNHDSLDIFEARFALAVKSLAVDAIRRGVKKDSVEVPAESFADRETGEGGIAVVERRAHKSAAPMLSEGEARTDLRKVLARLTPREREAVIAVHEIGLKIEAEDPEEETAATVMGVSGRAVRYLLKSARDKALAEEGQGK